MVNRVLMANGLFSKPYVAPFVPKKPVKGRLSYSALRILKSTSMAHARDFNVREELTVRTGAAQAVLLPRYRSLERQPLDQGETQMGTPHPN